MMSLQIIYTMDNLLTLNILTTSQYTWKIFEIWITTVLQYVNYADIINSINC